MKTLDVQVAHGWWSQGKPGAVIRVDYHAIGSPRLSRLVVSVSFDKNCPDQNSGLLGEQAGGAEMLSDEAVIIMASNHPDWLMGKDLSHILAVLEDRYDEPPDDLWAAREDLRVFVEALHTPIGQWEEEVAYAA